MSNIRTSLTLERGKFTKATFINMMAKKPNCALRAVGDRLIIREELSIVPNILFLSGISHRQDESDREAAIASINPDRRYYIESSNNPKFPEGIEVLLDWSQAMNMARVNGRTGTPTLIEAAAALDTLTFAETKSLDKLKNVTVYEYISIWESSVVCGIEDNGNAEHLLGKISIDVAPNLIKPATKKLILPGQ